MLNKSLGNISSTNVKEIINSKIELDPETIQELDSIAQLISDLKQAQNALHESETKYRLFFNNVPLGILNFDSNGIITSCNENILAIIDSSKEKIIGQKLIDLIDIQLVSAIENTLSGTVGHYEGDFVSSTSGKITPIRVNFAPIILDDGVISGGFGIFEDITERKQIERIFFHDIINTAGNLVNLVEMFNDEEIEPYEQQKLVKLFGEISKRIIDEINTHRHLVTSEKSKIRLNVRKIKSLDFLIKIVDTHNQTDLFDSHHIAISNDSENVVFDCDETLLGRVLGNMIKNAIEASDPGETILLTSKISNGMVNYSVHNSSYIPSDIQSQLFNRSVSTKGAGRGLGLYSMKYLTENYLKGKISFTSSKTKGTTFTVAYPLQKD
ncbi:MAG: hypothetical protein CVV24_07180 [Ignavibacteriae bacterium HGW-Ignavibacteriae-3]|nr:MAG: hypothetical protein CVV24_07180 [Ignavibacteriae bacterium HGW-Ignavibacteriae-3]